MIENWTEINSHEQVEEIREYSKKLPVLIFKHSTRCSISTLSWNRIKNRISKLNLDRNQCFYLDLIAFRPISDNLAEIFSVRHESPQILVILNDECVYDSSHLSISIDRIKQELESLEQN